MRHVCLLLAIVLSATGVAAQCRPEGRAQFTAGLDALSRGDLAAAASSFEALVHAQPDCAEARNNLAVVLVEQGRLDDAAEHLRRAVELQPDYQRARFNLERIAALRAAPQGPAARAPAAPAPAPPPAVPPPHLDIAPAAPIGTAADTKPAPPAVPAAIAALEPDGATACSIDPVQKRLCLYRRSGGAIATEECFPIVAAQARSWPNWLTASDTTAERIRLVDETGQRRLKVIPEKGAGASDVVRLSPAGFEALRAKVEPWKTGWVVFDEQTADAAPPGEVAAAVREALERWRQAWEQKQADDYFGQYSAAFAPQTEPDAEHWRARKRLVFEQSGAIAVRVEPPSIFVVGHPRTVITSFEQSYSSGVARARDQKVLRWQQDGARWKISAETVLTPYPQEPPGRGGE